MYFCVCVFEFLPNAAASACECGRSKTQYTAEGGKKLWTKRNEANVSLETYTNTRKQKHQEMDSLFSTIVVSLALIWKHVYYTWWMERNRFSNRLWHVYLVCEQVSLDLYKVTRKYFGQISCVLDIRLIKQHLNGGGNCVCAAQWNEMDTLWLITIEIPMLNFLFAPPVNTFIFPTVHSI